MPRDDGRGRPADGRAVRRRARRRARSSAIRSLDIPEPPPLPEVPSEEVAASRTGAASAYPGADRAPRRERLQFRDGASADAGGDRVRSTPAADQSGRDQLCAGHAIGASIAALARGARRARLDRSSSSGRVRPDVVAGPSRRRRFRRRRRRPQPAARRRQPQPPPTPQPVPSSERMKQRRRPDRASARLAAERRRIARFIVSDANREAFEHFRKWSMWPVKATILTGPRRSGRTLLARSFVERVGGRLFDDAERRDEEELFHAWNQAQDSGRPLVMIADEVPPAWSPQLPDLRTRLAVTPVARIDQPDDVLFAGADRAAVRRPRAAHPARCAALHDRAAAPRLLDGRAGGRGGRPLRDRRAGAADACRRSGGR